MGDAYAAARRGGLVGVWLYAYALGGHLVATAGAAGAGGFGVSLPGGWNDAGFLDAEPVPTTTRAGAQRSVHASGEGQVNAEWSLSGNSHSALSTKDEKRQEIDRKGGNLGDHRGAIQLREQFRQE